jgi:hypothetical protein
MKKEFYYKGHHFEVVTIEGSTDHTIIKDGRLQRTVSKYIAENAIQFVDKLFK